MKHEYPKGKCKEKANIVSYGEPMNLNSLLIKPWITGHQYTLNIAS